MTPDEIIQVKAALNALDRVGRLQEKTLLDHIEIAQCQPLPTMDGKRLIRKLLDKNWAGSFKDPVLEAIFYVITPDGRNALLSL